MPSATFANLATGGGGEPQTNSLSPRRFRALKQLLVVLVGHTDAYINLCSCRSASTAVQEGSCWKLLYFYLFLMAL